MKQLKAVSLYRVNQIFLYVLPSVLLEELQLFFDTKVQIYFRNFIIFKETIRQSESHRTIRTKLPFSNLINSTELHPIKFINYLLMFKLRF